MVADALPQPPVEPPVKTIILGAAVDASREGREVRDEVADVRVRVGALRLR